MALAGCGGAAGGVETGGEDGRQDAGQGATGYAYAAEDLDSAWDEQASTSIRLEGAAASVDGEGALYSDGAVTIGSAGSYVISGSLDDGQIVVDAGKGDIVRLVLKGASVYNADGPALYAKQSAKMVLTLADGTENTFEDGAAYNLAPGEDEPDAAIFADDSLSINGSGALRVKGNYMDGIRAKDILAVTGGDIAVEAVSDGLHGRDGVAMLDGDIVIKAGNDGIKSNNDEEGAKGFVALDGGSCGIEAENDGVQANGSLVVLGGAFSVQAGDDAFHADGALRVEGGEIDVAGCYEGLEGATVDIYGGSIRVKADDDAINAAGGSDESDGPGGAGGDSFDPGGGYYVRVAGGFIDALGGRDGIDSNGDIYIEGGDLRLSAQSMGMEGAIDLDGRLVITGGRLVAAGSVATPSSDSTQASLLVSHASAREEGSVIELRDEAGATVLEYVSRMGYSASAFSSPDMAEGGSYSLFIDGEMVAELALSGTATAVSDDGGPYAPAGGRGGPGGFARPEGGTRPGGGLGPGGGPGTSSPGGISAPEGGERRAAAPPQTQ
jgi:hypothetical protein